MKVSEFFENEISPFVLGTFFSRYKIENDYIITTSMYKSSSKLDEILYSQSIEKYLEILDFHSKSKIWQRSSNTTFQIKLQNDLKLDNDTFFAKILQKIMLSSFFFDKTLSDDKKAFLRGFFETRGSIDTSRPLLAQDYFYNSSLELRRFRYLIDNFFVPIEALNINFRELQDDFITGKNKRNTQFRINLAWYSKNIGFINEYKAQITKKVYGSTYNKINEVFYFDCDVPALRLGSIDERINLYLSGIYGKNLSDYEISKIRKDLEFDSDDSDDFKRNGNIIRLVRYGTDDICAACSDIYDIKDRSFLGRNNRYYTEIHHCISVGKDKELDVLENLSKLCPTCHRALKRGASSDEYQKGLIAKILKANKQNLEFAKIIFASADFDYLVDRIQENLN